MKNYDSNYFWQKIMKNYAILTNCQKIMKNYEVATLQFSKGRPLNKFLYQKSTKFNEPFGRYKLKC